MLCYPPKPKILNSIMQKVKVIEKVVPGIRNFAIKLMKYIQGFMVRVVI